MKESNDNLTLSDVQFLFLRLIFWLFVLFLILFIHYDALKETETETNIQTEQCLTTPSN